jgi:hypothetical protein
MAAAGFVIFFGILFGIPAECDITSVLDHRLKTCNSLILTFLVHTVLYSSKIAFLYFLLPV